MTSRLNLKFVIPLVAAVLVLGVASYFAVTKFVFKSADQHAAIAQEAMADGNAELASGNIEEANAYFDRAAKNLGAAFRKDPSNTEHLYQSIRANESFVCTQLTEAQNRLSMIFNGSKLAHDAIGATEEDRRQFYEMLMQRHRMGLLSNGSLPWIAYMNESADAEYQADPGNEMARRWRGISGVYLLRNDMPPEERAVPLEDLRAALDKAGEDDPLVLHAIAIWHYNEAQRLRDAAGGRVSDAVTAQFDLGRGFTDRAYQADPQNPHVAVDHLAVLMSSPLNDEVREQIGQVLLPLAQQLTQSQEARASLYPAEVLRLIGWLSAYQRLAPENEQPLDLALTLGERYAADAPNRPDHHQVHVQALLANDQNEAALQALSTGLAATRRLGPEDYLIDLQTKVAMTAQLVETNINLALPAEEAERQKYLDAADKALEQYRASEGADTRFHEARASYLAGRVAFVRNTPHLAIPHLESANLFYKNSDLQTLALLAKSHDRSGNLGTAAEYYEALLQLEPRARNERLRLVQIYIELGGENLALAQGHLNRFLEFNPDDVQARLLAAQLAATLERYEQAAEIVAGIGLEENPQLVATYAQYLAQTDQSEQALTLIQQRLTAEPNDANALSVLFTLVTDETQRLEALTALEANGLAPERVQQYRAMIENGGQMTIEEYIEMATASGTDELLIKKQLYVSYAQSNQTEKMRETLAELTAMAPRDTNVLEWRFLLALIDQDFALANRVIEDILSLPPADRPKIAAADGAFLRAQVLASRVQDQAGDEAADLREPIRAYRRALEERPSYAPGWVELGRLYLVSQDWPRAVEALNRAYSIQPTNVQAATLYARALRLNGESDLALDIYRSATRRQPNNRSLAEEYLALEASRGVRRMALEQRQTIRENNPSNIQNRQALAIMLAEDKRYDDALAEIASMEQDQGVSLTTAYARASVHAMAEDVQAGREALQRYIDGRGDDADANDYLALAGYLSGLGLSEEALPAYEQAVALEDPQTRRASRAWAGAMARGGQYVEAARLLQELVSAFPEEDALKFDLALVHIATGNADQAEAVLRQAGDSAQKQTLRAQSQMQAGQPDAALTIVRDALETYADNRELLSLEAQLLTQLGENDLAQGETARGRDRLTQAKTIYEGLVRSNSSLYELRVLIARLDYRLGAQEAAIDQLVRLLNENASVASARVWLFNFYRARAGELREADPRRAQVAQLALSAITPLVEEQPENIEVLRMASSAAREAGNPSAAVGYAQRVYDLSGGPQDLADLVISLLLQGQPGEALVLLNNPDHAGDLSASRVLRAMQARALAGSGRTAEARNLFSSLLRNAEGEADQLQVMLQLRQSSLQGEQVSLVEEALSENITPRINLQLALIEQSQEAHDAVVQRLRPWEQSPTADPAVQRQAMSALALAYQHAGGQDNLLRAKALYEGLLDETDGVGNLNLYNNLAYLLSDQLMGDSYKAQAVDYAQRAVDMMDDQMSDTDRALILDTLGWAQHRAGDAPAAIATLRRSIQSYPLSVNQKHLGQVYMAQNNNDQALLHLDNARRVADTPAEQAEIQGYIDEVRGR